MLEAPRLSVVVPTGREATRTFDYVIVGAGTAGCVVACRLAATGASVALLEAGGPYRRLLDVPLLSLWTWLRRPARYCWQNLTAPQAALDGLARRPAGGRQLGDQRDDLLPRAPLELRPMAAPDGRPIGHARLEL